MREKTNREIKEIISSLAPLTPRGFIRLVNHVQRKENKTSPKYEISRAGVRYFTENW